MKPTIVENIKEWFAELTLWKKIVFAIPFAIAFAGAAIWLFAKICAGSKPEKKPSPQPQRIVIDEQLRRHDEESRVFRTMVKAVQGEIDLIHKRGEMNDKDYQKLKVDLHDAGDDIHRVNAILARAREQRRN